MPDRRRDQGIDAPGDIGALVAPIIPAVEAVKDRPKDELLEAATEENTHRAISRLSGVDILSDRVAEGTLAITGGEYELASGKVELVG